MYFLLCMYVRARADDKLLHLSIYMPKYDHTSVRLDKPTREIIGPSYEARYYAKAHTYSRFDRAFLEPLETTTGAGCDQDEHAEMR